MSAAEPLGPRLSLKEKRERLRPAEKKIVKRACEAIEGQLIEALTELVSGVQVSGKQSSFTPTITLKAKRRKDGSVKNLECIVAPRVRAAREAVEFEVHIGDDNQLTMGWVEEDDDLDDDDDTFENPPGDMPGEAFED